MAATVKDIAKRTGLGLATISKYINGGRVREENRLAIEAAIAELDFTVNSFARSLKTSRSNTVGIVIPEFSGSFVTSIITVLEDMLRQNGYATMVCDCRSDHDREAEAVRFLLEKMVDGIINMPVNMAGDHLAPALERGLPVVCIDRMVESPAVDAVLVRNAHASREAVEYLLDCGHRNIGLICGPEEVYTFRRRALGYCNALEGRGLAVQPRLLQYGDNYTVENGYTGIKELLRQNPDMTAVLVTNYEMTLGAIIAINELLLAVPQELSIIGFDNLELSRVVKPKLTIITQPLEELGRQAATLMIQRLRGDTGPQHIIKLPTELLHGDSVRKIEHR